MIITAVTALSLALILRVPEETEVKKLNLPQRQELLAQRAHIQKRIESAKRWRLRAISGDLPEPDEIRDDLPDRSVLLRDFKPPDNGVQQLTFGRLLESFALEEEALESLRQRVKVDPSIPLVSDGEGSPLLLTLSEFEEQRLAVLKFHQKERLRDLRILEAGRLDPSSASEPTSSPLRDVGSADEGLDQLANAQKIPPKKEKAPPETKTMEQPETPVSPTGVEPEKILALEDPIEEHTPLYVNEKSPDPLGAADNLYRLTRYKEALVAYEAVIDPPKGRRVYVDYRKAMCLQAMGENAEALKRLAELSADHPDDVWGRTARRWLDIVSILDRHQGP